MGSGRAGHGTWGLRGSFEHSCECLDQQPGQAGLTGQPHRSPEAPTWREIVVGVSGSCTYIVSSHLLEWLRYRAAGGYCGGERDK